MDNNTNNNALSPTSTTAQPVPSSASPAAAAPRGTHSTSALATSQKAQRRRGSKQFQTDPSPDDLTSAAGTAALAPDAEAAPSSSASPRLARRDRNHIVNGGQTTSKFLPAPLSAGGAAAPPDEGGEEQQNSKSGEEADGKKMFQCKGFGNCRMSFSRSEHLARHIRKHTGERPFKCHCGRDFSRLDNLRQHAQTVHSDQIDKNTDMMQRLQSVHSALSASNRAKRGKTGASAAGGHGRTHSNPTPPPPMPSTAAPSMGPMGVSHAQLPPQPMHSGAPYYNPVPTDFAPPPPPPDYGVRQHQMMEPYYEAEGYPAYTLYPSDFQMPGRPTLPPISALIPRQGVSAPQTTASLLPSPLPPSAQIYAGHTSPVYAYPDAVNTSPRSAGPDGTSHPHHHAHPHQQHHQQAMAAAAAMGGGHPHHAAYHGGTPSPISPARMQHQQQQPPHPHHPHPHAHHAAPPPPPHPHQPILHIDEYGQQYYAMPPGLPGLDEQPTSPFVQAPVHHQPGDAGEQHGGIHDLLHAATTAVTPGLPNAEFFNGGNGNGHPQHHLGGPHPSQPPPPHAMRASVSPLPGSHYGTPSVSPAPNQQQQQQHQQMRRGSPGKRPRQEGEAEYLEQLNDSGAYFKRPMLTSV